MTQTTLTRAPARLVATIDRGPYGLWYVRATGNGYPIDHILSDTDQARKLLAALVEDGFEIIAPLHYLEMFDIFDEPVSQYEDSREAAEGPAVAMVSVPGDNGQRLATDDEIPF